MTKYWTPPTFFTQNFFYQNDSEWPKMDFKHNFKKYGILSVFLKASLTIIIFKSGSYLTFPNWKSINGFYTILSVCIFGYV